jgi:hypothetical protein
MKTTLIIGGAALGAVLLAAILLVILAPKSIALRTTQLIHAPKAAVMAQLRYLENFPKWSPFKEEDPTQRHWVTGTDGAVGATFHWEGVKVKSKGSQTIVTLRGDDYVQMQCDITVPFEAKPTFTYTLTEKNGITEVVQDFATEFTAPGNAFAYVFGVKGEMATTNQRGLALLQALVEGKTAPVVTMK